MNDIEVRTPLVEVVLQLQFEPVDIPNMNGIDTASVVLGSDYLELHSNEKISFGGLRQSWGQLLPSLLQQLSVKQLNRISLSYLNEIPLENLRNFQNYLNISIDMPSSLKDRIEFFRSEFTYRYDFGEIRVWLQPDWDDELEGYCIQLNLESRKLGPVKTNDLFPLIEQMHAGLKDVFRQVLSEDYVRQLPQ
jgi:uncharacterized protein (TIGR04255 family)